MHIAERNRMSRVRRQWRNAWEGVDSYNLDLQKSFDSVSHRILCQKWKELGLVAKKRNCIAQNIKDIPIRMRVGQRTDVQRGASGES